MRSTIICVDDEKMLLNILAEQLTQWFGSRYTIEKALSGEDALQILDDCISNKEEVSLIISDYVMPGMRGDELLGLVSKRDSRIRKIMLTGYSSVEGIANAINNGGLYRFITKPWDTKDLMLTIVEAIRSYEVERKNADLTKGFETMYKKYEALYLESQKHLEEAIDALSVLSRLREAVRGDTIKQISIYITALAKAMSYPDNQIKQFAQIAMLHEIGCAALTDEELSAFRNNNSRSVTSESDTQLLQKINVANSSILSRLSLPETVVNAIHFQFERLSGTGPSGLTAKEIPQEALLLSLVCYFVECRANLVQSGNYNKATAVRTLTAVLHKQFPSALVIPFIEIVKTEFAD